MAQESGNRFDVPWDAVLYHCEPSYEYYKGTGTGDALDSRAKLQRPNLSRLEHGQHEPSLETLERVAAALRVPVAGLVAR